MSEYTEPTLRAGRNRGGCLVLGIALVILLGLLMWFMLWGRAMPEPDEPPGPVEERAN